MLLEFSRKGVDEAENEMKFLLARDVRCQIIVPAHILHVVFIHQAIYQRLIELIHPILARFPSSSNSSTIT